MVSKTTFGSFFINKAQLVLMAILVVSPVNFIVGSIIGPTDAEEVPKGFVGFNCKYK